MFRLVKLAAFALLGYALYEFFRGMTEEQNQSNQSQGSSSRSPLESSLNRDPSRQPTLTGAGRGTNVATHAADGGSTPHVVGRGVVSR